MRAQLSALLLLASAMLASSSVAQTPASHRLMFAPTARAIPSGDLSVGLTEFIVPTASIGLGSGVSLGAGLIPVELIESGGMVFVEPKWTVLDAPGLALAIGTTAQGNLIDGGSAYAVPYVVATAGSTAKPGHVAATLGVGARVDLQPTRWQRVWGRSQSIGRDHEVHLAPVPTAFAGLEARATKRLSVMLEAGALPQHNRAGGRRDWGWCAAGLDPNEPMPSERFSSFYTLTGGAALRYATSRVAVDAGAIALQFPGGSEQFEPGPWLNVTVGLGQRSR